MPISGREADPIEEESGMRVVTQEEFGGPEVLRVADAPVPEPGPTEVRVKVEAAGVNPVD